MNEGMFEIVSDKENMRILVGDFVQDEPYLFHLPEMNRAMKERICPDIESYGLPLKDVYKAYAARLGAKFNRRFYAANYWLWIGDDFTPRTQNMLRFDGMHWRRYNSYLVKQAQAAKPYVQEAERDGLYHLIPAIVIFGKSPQQIKKLIGKGDWKRIAANSETRNKRLMQTIGRNTLVWPEAESTFVSLLDFRSGVLRGVSFADEMEKVAARVTPRQTTEAFQETFHYVRDAWRMMGAKFNPEWSLARIHEEHDLEVRRRAAEKHSPLPFADPWVFEKDGYTVSLLTSRLDVASEGGEMRHCVGSYAEICANGHYAALKVDGKERATIGLRYNFPTWALDQIYGRMNSRVSDECREVAYEVARELSKSLVKAA